MTAMHRQQKPGVINIFKCKCPRCRQENMFEDPNPYHLKRTMKMRSECPVCGQSFNLEVGFYYGSGYASYGLSLAVSVASLVIYWLTIGLSIHDYRFLYWLLINAVLLIALQPLLMRMARTLWLALFIPYDPEWKIRAAVKPERTNEDQQNNW